MDRSHYPVLAQVSLSYSEPKGRFPRVTHPCATRPEGLVRLACVRHAASVRSEPESNSQVDVRQVRRGIATGKPASLGAVPAQIYKLVCLRIRTFGTASIFPIADAQRPSMTGAAAHMSLHLNRQCQRADTSPSRVHPGHRLAVERDANGVGQRPCPVGERPYMEDLSYRQWPFLKSF